MRFLKLFLIGLALFFLAVRLALPSILLRYAESRLNQIPEYQAKISDLDVHLYRGSYTLKNIVLNKVDKNIPVPFFSAKAIDLSIEWRALLKGALVAKITAYHPEINFVIDAKGNHEQLSIDKEWQRAVKSLFPLNINELKVKNGKLALKNFNGNPPFNLFLKNIFLTISNMQKVTDENSLSSSFKSSAKTMDGALVSVDGRFDPFAKTPTFKLNASLKSMDIKAANAFLQHFTNADVAKGKFSLFIETAAAKGKIKGYAKPIVEDLKIFDSRKPMTPIEFLYKGALEIVSKIVTNSEKDTIATKINITGDVDDPDTSVLSIIGYVLRHAFIQALLPKIDHNIQMRDVMLMKNSKAPIHP